MRALLLGRAEELAKKIAAIQRDREINEGLLAFFADYTITSRSEPC